jgi:hypothetical protein
MYIRPAASESWYDPDDGDFWGMSDELEEEPVGGDPEVVLIPHLFSADAVPSTQAEAHAFWLSGGWDD